MVLMLHIHHARAADIIEPDVMRADPFIPTQPYRDGFGNWCTRVLAPAGRLRLSARALLRDSGEPDPIAVASEQHPVVELPDDVVVYLLGSRYCETDRLTEAAWDLFGCAPTGAARVQAICDYVHRHITFNYLDARATRTAWEAMQERKGVCRDYAHLAVALCRCMNIPARYCTGYLTDIGVEPPYSPMDFAAWFEAYIGGRWHTFDPRNNTPRIGRVLMARGRDATDVAISNAFGVNTLTGFTVWADEAQPQRVF
jgi:transglutaminase-like putative cysteine protease